MITAVIAALAGAILAPVLGRLLDRLFPARVEKRDAGTTALTDRRGVIIEYMGCGFMVLGFWLPFWSQDTVELAPTARNILAIFSSGLLCSIVGIWSMTSLVGDYRAYGFLTYFERVRGVNSRAARIIGISLAIISAAILIVLSVTQ